ncbi:type II toxin-antitoxin system RelE/ParE family toxin [Asticcacaulis sp.]|uniref:type II toxin-antitoxin system RelE/ParE family toxin n=1 Tax=Asticcacaulis sp. TaxID=1872648 RepID=UPI003F7B7C37
MKLEWSVFALADRDGIFNFIEADSPRSAINVDSAIEAQAERLIDFPESGRPGRIMGTREVVVAQLPYVIAYRVTSDKVRILRVLHGAQQWPDSLPQ